MTAEDGIMHHLPICWMCRQNSATRAGVNKHFVAELEGGFITLHPYQYFPGYAFFVAKQHYENQREMKDDERLRYNLDMLHTRDALDIACQPVSVNIAEMMNTVRHCHWHIVPRYGTDLNPTRPPWNTPKSVREAPEFKATDEVIFGYKQQIRSALNALGVRIIR